MKDRERYFERARTWATDTRLREARLLRTAWILAGVASAVALFEAVALALLTPLKTVQPVTLLVDRQTGYVQALDPSKPPRVGADGALTQSFLAQYVVAREGFDRATVSHDYQRVALWSAGPARAQYLARMPATNPDSPLQRIPAGVIVSAHVKSVSKLSEGLALVRFDTQMQDRNSRAALSQPWVAIVRFRYSDASMTFADRLVNPLGFQVVGYRRDPEAPVPLALDQPDGPATSPSVIARPTEEQSSTAYSRGRATTFRGLALGSVPMGSPLLPVAASGHGPREPLR